MKALTVREPWASLIAEGHKTLEIRSRRTQHRGPLVITMSRSAPHPHAGHAICVVDLVDCTPMDAGDADSACHPMLAGHYVWHLANVQRIHPTPVKGQLGVFTLPADFALLPLP